MGDQVRTLTLAVLADPANRQGGLADPAYGVALDKSVALTSAIVIDRTCNATLLISRVCAPAVNAALGALSQAIAAIPAAPASVAQAFSTLSVRANEVVRDCPEVGPFDPQWSQIQERCFAAISAYLVADSAFGQALIDAAQASAQANADTPAAFFRRFVVNLQSRIATDVASNFSRYWPSEQETGLYQPLVVYGQVLRGSIDELKLLCCLTRTEIEAPIQTIFYRVDGRQVQFSLGIDGRVDPFTWADTPIVTLETQLPALSFGSRVAPHTDPFEWVVNGTNSVQAAALACSREDGRTQN
jgi:hypothetical protein